MRITRVITGICVVWMCSCATAPSTPASQATNVTKTTALILEKNEGERRVWRGYPGHPYAGAAFFLKVDPKNGGSSHVVFGTEDLTPGDRIEMQKHPSSDEILFLQTGTARVHLGNSVREVHSGSTVFIPAGTWISVSNIGRDVINLAFVFSAPGFEGFMRAESARAGERNVPVSKAEDQQNLKRYSHVVIYQ